MPREPTRDFDFFKRVMKRCRQFGMNDSEIARGLGVNPRTVIFHIGPGRTWAKTKKANNFLGRVMSRLITAPIRLKQKDIAELYGFSSAYVCVLIKEARYPWTI